MNILLYLYVFIYLSRVNVQCSIVTPKWSQIKVSQSLQEQFQRKEDEAVVQHDNDLPPGFTFEVLGV